jgi:hypothetical protein
MRTSGAGGANARTGTAVNRGVLTKQEGKLPLFHRSALAINAAGRFGRSRLLSWTLHDRGLTRAKWQSLLTVLPALSAASADGVEWEKGGKGPFELGQGRRRLTC